MPQPQTSGSMFGLRTVLLMALATFGLLMSSGLLAQQVRTADGYDYMRGEVLVKFKADTPPEKIQGLNEAIGGQIIGTFRGYPELYHIKVPESLGAGTAVSFYNNNDDAVEYAELNIVYYTCAIPNDPGFSSQYA